MRKISLVLAFTLAGFFAYGQAWDTDFVVTPQFEYHGEMQVAEDTTSASAKVPKAQFEYHETTTEALDPTPTRTIPVIAPQFEKASPEAIITADVHPTIQWTALSHDFGKIDYQQPMTSVFEFVNTSDAPIFIKDAKGSCGCTATDFPKTPILPQQTAQIKATYDAKNIGPFEKTLTVYTSADTNEDGTILYLTGEVVWRL